jgi:hypothetical protein
MALPSWLLVSVGGRCSQRPRPSPTLESLGPSHQRRHKYWVSLWDPYCAHVVLGKPHGEVRDNNNLIIFVFLMLVVFVRDQTYPSYLRSIHDNIDVNPEEKWTIGWNSNKMFPLKSRGKYCIVLLSSYELRIYILQQARRFRDRSKMF